MEDAILNLAINARDGMPDGGEMVIKTTNTTIDETCVQCNPQLKVLITSGFTRKQDELASGKSIYLSRLFSDLLSKPFDRPGLATVVRKVLVQEVTS